MFVGKETKEKEMTKIIQHTTTEHLNGKLIHIQRATRCCYRMFFLAYQGEIFEQIGYRKLLSTHSVCIHLPL